MEMEMEGEVCNTWTCSQIDGRNHFVCVL